MHLFIHLSGFDEDFVFYNTHSLVTHYSLFRVSVDGALQPLVGEMSITQQHTKQMTDEKSFK